MNELQGASKCPSCGGIANAVPHTEFRWVCNLCGAPRIEVKGEGIALSGEEKPYLERANKAKTARAAWRFGGFVGGALGGFGLVATLLMYLIFGSVLLAGAGIALSFPFLLLALAAFAKDNARSREIDEQVDSAWRIAGRDVVMQSKSITAEQLTEILPMNQLDAEQLAAELAVDEQLHSRINEEGRIQLSPVAQTQVRIDAAADAAGPTIVADDPLEERFAALEEAIAAEQQADKKTHKI